MTRPAMTRPALLRLALLALLCAPLPACAQGADSTARDSTARDSTAAARAFQPTAQQAALLDTLERRTFDFFWERSDSVTGLTPDRWPTKSFVSVSATGFALTAYPIGVRRGWVTRAQARERVVRTLRFFWTARQDSLAAGCTGYKGFFYHFLDPATGTRFEKVELSTIDTALLVAGALFCAEYFDGPNPGEAEIRTLADSIYSRVDWRWAQVRPALISHGWTPEEGHLPYDWGGYNEALILQVLALASPTHPATRGTYEQWLSGYKWGTFHGEEYVGFAPLFGHQYSHVWLDLRGIRDAYMRGKGIDYFENARRATYAQRAYAIANPSGFRGYGERLWGLSACDGPFDGTLTIEGRKREFRTYAARGACFTEVTDDGTIAPTAALSSLPYAPEIVLPLLVAMREDWGAEAFGRYGFIDAFNPTLDVQADTHHGRVVEGVGWFDTDYLGIDQGPILAMAENWRTGLIWRTLRRNPAIERGLRLAGFTGGWLDGAAVPGRTER